MENSPASVAAESSEILAWETIRERYPNQWVILVDLVERDFQTLGGRVFAHGPGREDVREGLREAIRTRGGAGHYWTGELGNPCWTWKLRALRGA